MHPLVVRWLPAGGFLFCWAGYCRTDDVNGLLQGGIFAAIAALLLDSCLPANDD